MGIMLSTQHVLLFSPVVRVEEIKHGLCHLSLGNRQRVVIPYMPAAYVCVWEI